MIHIGLMSIAIPANANLPLSIFVGISNVKLINVDTIEEKIFGFTERYQVPTNFYNMGFESAFVISNLGTQFYIIVGALLFMLVLLMLKPVSECCIPLFKHLYG